MLTSCATPLATPLAVILTDDGDDSVDLVPVNAMRDGDGNPILDSNNNFILS
jgi:hypothetical protein